MNAQVGGDLQPVCRLGCICDLQFVYGCESSACNVPAAYKQLAMCMPPAVCKQAVCRLQHVPTADWRKMDGWFF